MPAGSSKPLKRRLLTAGALVALAAAIGAGAALIETGASDPASAPAAQAHTTTAEAVAAQLPADQIHHVTVSDAEAKAARAAAAKAAAQQKAARKTQPAKKLHLKPGEMPPASAGTNGTYKPPSAAKSAKLADRAQGAEAELFGKTGAVLLGRVAVPPNGAPEAVNQAISAANAITNKPYIWGGGHGSWNARGYDCSGAVSYALGGAGLLQTPLDSSHLERWGKPGPGRWITVYANPGHAYAMIAGLRWDTSGDAHGTGPRWHQDLRPPQGYVVRHPTGL